MKNGIIRTACLLAAIAAPAGLATAQQATVQASVTVIKEGSSTTTITDTCSGTTCTRVITVTYIN